MSSEQQMTVGNAVTNSEVVSVGVKSTSKSHGKLEKWRQTIGYRTKSEAALISGNLDRAEREEKLRLKKQMEEDKLRKIWEDAQKSKEEAREAKREIMRQKELKMAQVRAELKVKQEERARNYKEMMEGRRQAELETQRELARIRHESRDRRYMGYWRDGRPDFPEKLPSEESGNISAFQDSHKMAEIVEKAPEEKKKVHIVAATPKHTAPRKPEESQKVEREEGDSKSKGATTVATTAVTPVPSSRRRSRKSQTQRRRRRNSSAKAKKTAEAEPEDEPKRSQSLPIKFEDVARRVMFARRRYSAMKLKVAVTKKMRNLMLNKQTNAFNDEPSGDYEKPNLMSISFDDLLKSESNDSIKARAQNLREDGNSRADGLRILSRKWSILPSSVGTSVELDHFIAPKDCDDILQKTISDIKETGVCSKIIDVKHRQEHLKNLRSMASRSLPVNEYTMAASNQYQELERLNHFLEEVLDKMKDCAYEKESKISMVEITDQIVKYLTEEEFHMFRFCMDLEVDHPVPSRLRYHPLIRELQLFIENYKQTLRLIFVFFKTHQVQGSPGKVKEDLEGMDEVAHQCLTFIKGNFGFHDFGHLKPNVIAEIMKDEQLVGEGMKSYRHRLTFTQILRPDEMEDASMVLGENLGVAQEEEEDREGRVSRLESEVEFNETVADSFVVSTDADTTDVDKERRDTNENKFKTPKVIRRLKDKVAPREQWQRELDRLCLGIHSPPDVEKVTQLVDRYYLEHDDFSDCYGFQREKLEQERERNKRELFRQLWELRNQIYMKKIGIDAYFRENAFIGYKKRSDLSQHLADFKEKHISLDLSECSLLKAK